MEPRRTAPQMDRPVIVSRWRVFLLQAGPTTKRNAKREPVERRPCNVSFSWQDANLWLRHCFTVLLKKTANDAVVHCTVRRDVDPRSYHRSGSSQRNHGARIRDLAGGVV